MNEKDLRGLLTSVAAGSVAIEAAMERLSALPFGSMDDAMVDTHRALRLGFPEVIFSQGKTEEQVERIAAKLAASGNNVLATRLSQGQADRLLGRFGASGVTVDMTARCALVTVRPVEPRGIGPIAVVAAGTSDLPVAREAVFTARSMGNEVCEVFDVGVAGIHRLFHHRDTLRAANVLVVVAGMEGALPSVVGGLVSRPVIAVPTSIGYGASFHGITALLAMLNSCSPGITVVNIDNGFGAAYAAALINRRPA
jgi:NCAIR mutase (PurE)-related protein